MSADTCALYPVTPGGTCAAAGRVCRVRWGDARWYVTSIPAYSLCAPDRAARCAP